MSRLPEEAQQVVGSQPHGGAVGHGVEEDHGVPPLEEVPVQNQLHALVLVEEHRERRRTALTHLDRRRHAAQQRHSDVTATLRRRRRGSQTNFLYGPPGNSVAELKLTATAL